MSPNPVAGLIDALADGGVRVVDLTQPLSEKTPVLVLPEPFANTPPLSRRTLSRYDDDGPAWAWDVMELGEHTGTHFDAPIHWISGRGGEDVASVPPSRLVGPAVVIDKSAEAAEDPGYLLTVADLEAFEAEHGPMPAGAWVLFRSGWGARADDAAYGAEVHHFGPQGHPTELVRFPDTDFAALARAAGAQGVTATRLEDLDAIGPWLQRRDGPLVVDAKITPDFCAEWLEEAFK